MPLGHLSGNFQRVKKLASKLHVHSVNFVAKLVHTRRALSCTIINSHQEPVCFRPSLQPSWSPLIFPFLFVVEELYGTRYQSGSFSLINVGSAFRCLRMYVVFSFFLFLSNASGMDESCDFPWIYNVSNGFTVNWLFSQFRWSSCSKLAIFSDCKSEYYHRLLSVAWAVASFSRREGGDIKHTFMGRRW